MYFFWRWLLLILFIATTLIDKDKAPNRRSRNCSFFHFHLSFNFSFQVGGCCFPKSISHALSVFVCLFEVCPQTIGADTAVMGGIVTECKLMTQFKVIQLLPRVNLQKWKPSKTDSTICEALYWEKGRRIKKHKVLCTEATIRTR